MFSFVVCAALLLNFCDVAKAQWQMDATCGRSKYNNAGEMPPGSKERMIVGGIPAQANEFPWQVSIQNRMGSHYCGGSIITDQWILTAAHCMVGDTPAVVQVSAGDHIRNAQSNVRQILYPERIIIHAAYNSQTFANDVALIKLNTRIQFNDNVRNICPPETQTYADNVCVCSGWGTLSSGGACCPQTLQYVSMYVITNAACQASYRLERIGDDMICATDRKGSQERDSCQGDSGGPLSTKTSNGQFRSIGVVSWGYGCASGWPGVYARTSFFVPWINQQIAAFP